jgi:rare lipoprotein A
MKVSRLLAAFVQRNASPCSLAAAAFLLSPTSVACAEVCSASQYGVGDGYHGRRTASGERFNTYATNPYTVAHRKLPFGSMVTITNLANGRSIAAKVNDRGPFARHRCVDLGRAGADAIGMGSTARVRVDDSD